MLLDGAKRMLDHFIETTQQFIRVPNIDEFLFVDIRGEFYSPSLTGMTHYGAGELELTVHVKGVQYVVSKLNLIQVSWKPVHPDDFVYYLTEREVLFTDNNTNNRHPINLIWAYEESKVGDMFRIPGFSWYLMSDENQIYSRLTNVFLTPTYIDGRHATAYIAPDYKMGVGNSIGIHRLVAFSKIPYSNNVCRLDVNHIDGNKWNFKTDNLEWATRRQNNIHAQRTGLKKDSNAIKVTDLETSTVSEYFSQAECGRSLGIDPRNLSMYIRKNNGIWTYKDRYKIEVVKVGLEKPKHFTSARSVLVKNVVTGEIQEFTSLAKAAPAVGMTVAALKARHKRGTTIFGNLHLKSWNPLLGESKPTFDV